MSARSHRGLACMAIFRWKHVVLWCVVALAIQLCLSCAILFRASRTAPQWKWSPSHAESRMFGFSWVIYPKDSSIAQEAIQWHELPAEIVDVSKVEAGWPLPAVQRTTLHANDPDPGPGVIRLHVSYALPEMLSENLSLYRPHYIGLLSNVLLTTPCVIGAHLLIVMLIQRSAKWRRKHGQCTKCAYDLRGTAPQKCPECGTAT